MQQYHSLPGLGRRETRLLIRNECTYSKNVAAAATLRTLGSGFEMAEMIRYPRDEQLTQLLKEGTLEEIQEASFSPNKLLVVTEHRKYSGRRSGMSELHQTPLAIVISRRISEHAGDTSLDLQERRRIAHYLIYERHADVNIECYEKRLCASNVDGASLRWTPLSRLLCGGDQFVHGDRELVRMLLGANALATGKALSKVEKLEKNWLTDLPTYWLKTFGICDWVPPTTCRAITFVLMCRKRGHPCFALLSKDVVCYLVKWIVVAGTQPFIPKVEPAPPDPLAAFRLPASRQLK